MRTSDIAAIALGIGTVALGSAMWLLDQRLTEVEGRLEQLEVTRWDGRQLSSPDGENHTHHFFGNRNTPKTTTLYYSWEPEPGGPMNTTRLLPGMRLIRPGDQAASATR